MTRILVFLAAACWIVSGGCHRSSYDPRRLVLATTTSLVATGLLDELLPQFERENGCRVIVIASGSGAALRQGGQGDADVVLAHDPEAEQEALDQGLFAERWLVMSNYFVVAGPPQDPSGIRGLASAVEAFRSIERSKSLFVSRADGSGTHRMEQRIWRAVGGKPQGRWYLEAGSGMAEALRMAAERKAYCLTDQGTLLVQGRGLDIVALVTGDTSLYNPYHLLLPSPHRHPEVNYALARKFSCFLRSPGVQEMIGRFGRDKYGAPLYRPADASAQETTSNPEPGYGEQF